MTSRAPFSHQLKVGIFMALGIVVTCASILMVGGNKFLRKQVSIHAYFESVQGLNEGSVVSLSGISIGNVKDFVFIPEENKLDVVMTIDAEHIKRITEGSSIEIRTAGALGDKYIYITPGPPNAPALKPGDRLLNVNEKDIMAIISEKGTEAGKVFDIIQEIDKFTKALNDQGRTAVIMKNMAEASYDLKAAAKDSRELISQLRTEDAKKVSASMEKLDRILNKIDRGEGTLGALINDPSLHESLKSMVGASDKKKSIKSLIRSSIQKSEDGK